MRYKLLTTDVENKNGRIYPLKEVQLSIKTVATLPIKISDQDKLAGTFSDFKLEGNVLTGRLASNQASTEGQLLGLIESDSDYVMCGTGFVDEKTGAISKWSPHYVSVVPKGAAA